MASHQQSLKARFITTKTDFNHVFVTSQVCQLLHCPHAMLCHDVLQVARGTGRKEYQVSCLVCWLTMLLMVAMVNTCKYIDLSKETSNLLNRYVSSTSLHLCACLESELSSVLF